MAPRRDRRRGRDNINTVLTPAACRLDSLWPVKRGSLSPGRRFLHGGLRGIVPVAALLLSLMVSPATAAPCSTDGDATFTLELCLNGAAEGATLAGSVPISVSSRTFVGKARIRSVTFWLGSEYVLRDVAPPFEFTLHTGFHQSGRTTLRAEAAVNTSFTLSVASSITIQAGVEPPPGGATWVPRTGRLAAAGAPFVVAAAGDGPGGRPEHGLVTDLVSGFNPNLVLFLGDVYDGGSLDEFANFYGFDPSARTFGRFHAITNPALGNHEYEAELASGIRPPTAKGYRWFWGGIPDHYSVDAGNWHFVTFNSNCATRLRCESGSAEYEFLKADLAGSRDRCTIAFSHHPRFSSGPQSDTTSIDPLWRLLTDAGVEIHLSGHEHSYQRFVPLNGDGVPQPQKTTSLVVGTAGYGVQALVRSDPRVVSAAVTEGALRLDLTPVAATMQFVATDGTVLDSSVVHCNRGSALIAKPKIAVAAPSGPGVVTVAWTPVARARSYEIYRDGRRVGTTRITRFRDGTGVAGRRVGYRVLAVDAAGRRSPATRILRSRSLVAPAPGVLMTKVAPGVRRLTLGLRFTQPGARRHVWSIKVTRVGAKRGRVLNGRLGLRRIANLSRTLTGLVPGTYRVDVLSDRSQDRKGDYLHRGALSRIRSGHEPGFRPRLLKWTELEAQP